MGISEGKIILYTVIAGVDPAKCLPVCLDVGTENKSLLDDPEYKGLRQHRIRGAAYDSLIDEFMTALLEWRPHVLLQVRRSTRQGCSVLHDSVVFVVYVLTSQVPPGLCSLKTSATRTLSDCWRSTSLNSAASTTIFRAQHAFASPDYSLLSELPV